MRHTNNRDCWLVGVTSEGQYCSWLLTPNGLAASPVISLQPRWIGSQGILKASPDGQVLAFFAVINYQLAQNAINNLELARFNPSTGRVDDVQRLPSPLGP